MAERKKSQSPIARTSGPLESLLRETVLTKMGYHGDAATIAEARRCFAAHCDGKESMDGNIRASVYLTVMAHGDEDTFNKLIELHDKADMQEETRRIQKAVGASKDESLIKKALDFALSDKVRNQDVIFVVVGATCTPAAQSLAWQFVRDNWSKFQSRCSTGSLIRRLIQHVTENFVTEERAIEVEEFFRANPAPSAERTILQSCEKIRLNKNWLQRDEACIREFLE